MVWCWAESHQTQCVLVCLTGHLHSHLKVLTAGLKTYEIPPDYSGTDSSLNLPVVHLMG